MIVPGFRNRLLVGSLYRCLIEISDRCTDDKQYVVMKSCKKKWRIYVIFFFIVSRGFELQRRTLNLRLVITIVTIVF